MIEEATYYVVFTRGITRSFTRLINPYFSHIYILTRDEFNWILLNPSRGYFQIEILPISITESPLNVLRKKNDTVLHIAFSRRDDRKQHAYFGLYNCVTWAKYTLGLPIKCLTPFQLYKRLLNFSASDKKKYAVLSVSEV